MLGDDPSGWLSERLKRLPWLTTDEYGTENSGEDTGRKQRAKAGRKDEMLHSHHVSRMRRTINIKYSSFVKHQTVKMTKTFKLKKQEEQA